MPDPSSREAVQPVVWAVVDVHGDFREGLYKSERAATKDLWHFDGAGGELDARAPHRVVPLVPASSLAAARAEEREACAAECERISADSKFNGYGTESAAEQGCADAIRAARTPAGAKEGPDA